MTTRGTKTNNTTRIEVEIEKNREEGNWSKVIELAEQLKDKTPEFVCLCDFLIGEGKLENYIEEWPPIETNISRAKVSLIEAKRYLHQVTNDAGIKAGVAMDAHLLLGKLQYACGQYADGIKHFAAADLSNLSEKKLPLRSLRIVAESYAIKGLCLQKDEGAATKFKKAGKEEDINKCFSLASDLGLLYMQKIEQQNQTSVVTTLNTSGTHSPQPTGIQKSLGVVLEQAMQNAPMLLLQQGKLEQALERYRTTLCAVECSGITGVRLKFMCQLAELLLQGQLGENYVSPLMMPQKSSLWKPKHYASLSQFIPKNQCEEVILLLSVAESMAVKNAVLSQSPEFKEARLSAYIEAVRVYDLLTIATVRWGQVALLQESLERSMKFSFEELYLWKQNALSLISIGKYSLGLSVLKEVIRLDPKAINNYLLAAKICYQYLNLPQEGVKYAREAVLKDLENNSGFLGRAYLYVGIGYHLLAEASSLKKDRDELRLKALSQLRSAVDLEPNDHLCQYYLGLLLALTDQLADAQHHVRMALDLHPEHSATLHLLVLLLSAEQEHKHALAIVNNALEEYPDSLNLMYLKALLEKHEEGPEKALCSAKQMLELWKNLYEGQTNSDMPECDRKSDTRSIFQLYPSEMSDKDSSSLRLQNTSASRIEQALSEVASSMSSFNPRPGPHRAWMLQVEIWLLLAELYLDLDQPGEVQQCIMEATQIHPLSHHIMHTKALLHMHKEQWPVARQYLQNALAINTQHVSSLQQLGLIYHHLELQGLAETTLREAAKIEPKNHVTWYNLGRVLKALGEYDKASSAMATALMEEKSNPILPFNSVSLCLE
ncbi:tetratricopeptide repeat protein 7B [Coccinella septempunctata]|uniref:tetratricopeptide repeat protein 7B n=1 Tax=Coccinella septempunctata TaxID=41139 RepID=UPI001D08C8A4|nr:tetratricopeptide repeat protein 7B [Coccinella septempunctata]